MSQARRQGGAGSPMQAALAIDIGGSYTKFAVVNASGGMSSSTRIQTDLDGGPEAYVNRLLEAAEPLASGGDPVRGVGMSVAGFVDAGRTAITYNPNLRALEGYPLRRAIEERLRLPVAMDVDSNAACLAEYHFGAGPGAKRLLCLVIGTGFGGAMMIDGQLERPAAQAIGDPGHVIVDPGGRRCSCGGRGCAEALVSAPAIEELAGGKPFAEVVRAASGGEANSQRALAEAGHWLGVAIATLAAIFLPDRIVIAGGVAEAGELLLEPARAAFRSSAGTILQQGASIVKASLGWRAPLIGAACPFLVPSTGGAN